MSAPGLLFRTLDRVQRIREQRDAGFTLIEALVSFVIFAIVSVAVVSVVITGIRTTSATTSRVTATNVAQQDIAKARAVAPADISAAGYPITVTQGKTTYTVGRAISYSSGTACPDSPGSGSYLNLTDTVAWNGASNPVRMDTVIAC